MIPKLRVNRMSRTLPHRLTVNLAVSPIGNRAAKNTLSAFRVAPKHTPRQALCTRKTHSSPAKTRCGTLKHIKK
jgi:hypothetical protein